MSIKSNSSEGSKQGNISKASLKLILYTLAFSLTVASHWNLKQILVLFKFIATIPFRYA